MLIWQYGVSVFMPQVYRDGKRVWTYRDDDAEYQGRADLLPDSTLRVRREGEYRLSKEGEEVEVSLTTVPGPFVVC